MQFRFAVSRRILIFFQFVVAIRQLCNSVFFVKRKNWNRTLWEQAIAKLPKGLTVKAIAGRLKKDYSLTNFWLRKFDYQFPDQRGIHLALLAKKRAILKPSRVNWSQSNISIAKKFGVSRERVRQVRANQKQPKPNGRKS